MKIAVITHFIDYNNYGQRLQNIALVKYLKDFYNTNDVYSFYYKNTHNDSDVEKKYLKTTLIDFKNLDTIKGYDLYVIGSDQVFFPAKNTNLNKLWNGSLLVKNGLKHLISYAGSANKNTSQLASIIKNFKYISFREKEDFESFKIQHSTYNIDPVFLQDKNFYTSLEKKPNFINDYEVFDFYYIKNKEKKTEIKENNGIKQVYLYFNNYIKENFIGYGEFLYLIHHCRYLITDSFHGFAFGIIYEKRFIEFANNYRVKNLIEILNCKIYNNAVVNYDEIKRNIQIEQQRSRKYFLDCSVFNYCCYSKDKYIRDNSTSGGICAELSKHIFLNNGIVYAARYNNDFTKVIIDSVDNLNDYFKYFTKSKYNFSYMPKLSVIKDQLDNGKLIMYIGSPCQILSLKKYLKKDYDNLILVDFKCQGFSHTKKLVEFTNKIKKEYNSNIKNIDFRYKHRANRVIVYLDNGQILNFDESVYRDFVFNIPEKCRKCFYKHNTKSYADITVGDFWKGNKTDLGLEFKPYKGCSAVRTNTHKGFMIFNQIKNNLECKQLFKAFI